MGLLWRRELSQICADGAMITKLTSRSSECFFSVDWQSVGPALADLVTSTYGARRPRQLGLFSVLSVAERANKI